ncbi:T9SS type A sorting domain-containing protein [candidate division KSB1 bacterium]|nr:T9SS type A sorting domain-containing protein [candidate division KSB1 bacterium]
MLKKLIVSLFLVHIIFLVKGDSQEVFGAETYEKHQTEEPMATLININKLAMWVQSDGISARNPFWQINGTAIPWGTVYPQGMPVGVVFTDGFVWGGFVQDGQEPTLRVGGHTWPVSGLQPGAILSSGIAEAPNDPQVNRVWRYRSDWQAADLTFEAFDILISRPDASSRDFQFSQGELNAVADSLRMAYEKDLQDWPWQKGAPFYDSNNNGIMDENEEPGLLNAPQVVWFVVNDLNPELTQALYGSPPIGIEMQVTLWAYNHDIDIENSIYRRIRLIYKGTDTTPSNAIIEGMAVGFYSEVDLGSFRDDLAGTDTTLQMVFGYNSTSLDAAYRQFDSSPPALGYTLLYGPIVDSANENDIAIFNFGGRKGFRNLPMTGSWTEGSGDQFSQPRVGNYDGTLQYYNVLNGFHPRPENPPTPFLDATTGEPTRFTITGDPVANTGWIDNSPGERNMTLTSSSFNMALGDTQEVVIIMTAGLGADRLASIEVMNFFARKAREFAQFNFEIAGIKEHKNIILPESFHLYQNFPNPFNPRTAIQYDLPIESHVKLTVYNTLGKKVKTLIDENQSAGSHSAAWDGTNAKGGIIASGVYFYKIQAGAFIRTREMIFVK